MVYFFGPRHNRGASLISLLIFSVIFVIILAAVMRTLQSSYRSQANLRQFSDFDTMKTNVKTVLFSKDGCRAQFRDESMNPVIYNSSGTTRVPILSVDDSPMLQTKTQYGLGVQVADLGLEPLSAQPRVVEREIDGREKVLDAYDVSLTLRAQTGASAQLFDPAPRFSVLVDQDTDEILACEASAISGTSGNACESLGGVWNSDTFSCEFGSGGGPLVSGSCPSGQVVVGVSPTGGLICLPSQSATASFYCPPNQFLQGVNEFGQPVCRGISCPQGQFLESIDAGGAPVCRQLQCPEGHVLRGVNESGPVCLSLLNTCPAGTYVTGFGAGGAPICAPIQNSNPFAGVACPEGQFLRGISSTGQPQCGQAVDLTALRVVTSVTANSAVGTIYVQTIPNTTAYGSITPPPSTGRWIFMRLIHQRDDNWDFTGNRTGEGSSEKFSPRNENGCSATCFPPTKFDRITWIKVGM